MCCNLMPGYHFRAWTANCSLFVNTLPYRWRHPSNTRDRQNDLCPSRLLVNPESEFLILDGYQEF